MEFPLRTLDGKEVKDCDVATALGCSVNELELNTRAVIRLMNQDLTVIWHVCVLSDKELRTIHGMGRCTLAHIRKQCRLALKTNDEFATKLQAQFTKWGTENDPRFPTIRREKADYVSQLQTFPIKRRMVNKLYAESKSA